MTYTMTIESATRKPAAHARLSERLPELPEGWSYVTLGDIATYYSGLTGKSAGDFGTGVPYVPYTNIYENGVLDSEQMDLVEVGPDENQSRVRYGDILVTGTSETRDEAGLTSVVLHDPGELYLNSFCFGVRLTSDRLLPEFAAYVLRSAPVRREIVRLAQGSTRYNLSKREFMKLPIPVPPMEVQEHFGEMLAAWDLAAEKLENEAEAKERRQRGLMQQLFPDHEAEAPPVRLPGFRDRPWVQVTMGEVFRERREKNHDHLPLLAVTGEWGVIPRDELDRKDTSASDKSRYLRALPGDIVYNTMRMWQGVAGLSAHEGIVSPAYTVVVPKKSMDARFAAYLFKHPLIIHRFYRYSQGLVSDTWNLKFRHFKEVKALVPPTAEEQRAIADLLDASEREIDLLRRERAVLLRQKKGLMQRLLNGRAHVPEASIAEASS